MYDTVCTVCEKPIKDLEIFGSQSEPLCWECFCVGAVAPTRTWYGLAPHHHDLSKTGSIIGSTVFDPLPEANGGIYDLGYATFWPDPDAPGCGVWTEKG